jgi:hypothetical protein
LSASIKGTATVEQKSLNFVIVYVPSTGHEASESTKNEILRVKPTFRFTTLGVGATEFFDQQVIEQTVAS